MTPTNLLISSIRELLHENPVLRDWIVSTGDILRDQEDYSVYQFLLSKMEEQADLEGLPWVAPHKVQGSLYWSWFSLHYVRGDKPWLYITSHNIEQRLTSPEVWTKYQEVHDTKTDTRCALTLLRGLLAQTMEPFTINPTFASVTKPVNTGTPKI